MKWGMEVYKENRLIEDRETSRTSIEKARTGKVEYVSKGILSKVKETDGGIV